MRIDGRWLAGADGIERPVLDGELSVPGGLQIALLFLIDTGADSTVLAPTVMQHPPGDVRPSATGAMAIGIGGALPMHELEADLLLPASSGQRARIHGPLPIVLAPGSLELSVIGRDVLDQFTLIYDRPRNLIALLTPPDTYSISP